MLSSATDHRGWKHTGGGKEFTFNLPLTFFSLQGVSCRACSHYINKNVVKHAYIYIFIVRERERERERGRERDHRDSVTKRSY
jgi:hypothetical protein